MIERTTVVAVDASYKDPLQIMVQYLGPVSNMTFSGNLGW